MTSNAMASEKIPFFALLIGINIYKTTYTDLRPLRGAVSDALEFKKYLESCLEVPSDQIKLLINEDATRFNIVDALEQLKNDDRVDAGDAIFLYYAGHGTEIDPPKRREWGAKKIQAIVPHDCDVVDESGARVPPIPDYVLGFLLSEIAKEKGDNITVVFDCCHSASGTRSTNADQIARSVELQSSSIYAEQLDQERLEVETRSKGEVISKFVHHGLRSHILLSACRAKQKAHEEKGRGLFSTALLKLLYQVSLDTLRYCDILTHPSLDPIPGQDPQCEGHHTHRTLFNAKVLPSKRHQFRISFNNAGDDRLDQCVVHGGIIHNITQDSEFAVYQSLDITQSTKICILHVDTLGDYSFTAKLPSDALQRLDPAQPAIAVQTTFGRQEHLRIYIPPNDGFHQIYRDLLSNSKGKNTFDNISLVDKSKDAQVEVTLITKKNKNDKDEVKFTLHAAVVVPNVVTTAQIVDGIETDPTYLAWIFARTAHFYWELKHRNPNPKIKSFVEVQFYKLKEECYSDPDQPTDDYFLTPDSRNLCTEGLISLFVPDKPEEAEGIPYGLKLINRSNQSLHANVFHFNSHDLQIDVWAASHSGCDIQAVEGTLSAGGTLDIGFGTAGYSPRSFSIKDGLDIDVGFLKIFLSTKSVSLADLPQDSPFSSTTRTMGPWKRKAKGPEPNALPEALWTDIVIPIILRPQSASRDLSCN